MKSFLFFVCAFVFTNYLFSQDTIQFINKPLQVVKVIEVGIDEIKFKRYDNLDGPLYVTNKKDIRYIKFANGHVDSVTIASKTMVTAPEPLQIYQALISTQSDSKIFISGNVLLQNGRSVGESRLYKIISNVQNPEKKAVLLKEYIVMKSYKKKQYLFGFVGLGVGVALPYIGFMSSFIFYDEMPLIIGVASGATLGITGAVISRIFKSKRNKQKIKVAELYNN